jgi:cell wall-associated NlpC family hydrolase
MQMQPTLLEIRSKSAESRTPTAVSREAICAIARSWLGTPYHHMGRLKGIGVDCAMFPLEVYREAGLIGDVEIPFYPPDWHLHRAEEVYLGVVEEYAREITLPGAPEIRAPAATAAGSDFVLYQFGRTWSHGAIVLNWPLIIHAVVQHGVILSDGERDGMLAGRRRRFFSLGHCHSEPLILRRGIPGGPK